MNIPNDLSYSASHEWVKFEGEGRARVGLTDYAQQTLGDLVYINLPEAGDRVTVGKSFADVESVKAVSDVYSPLSGTIEAVNEALLDEPESINAAPYDAWIVLVRDVTEQGELMDAEAYEALCQEEG